MPAGQMDALGAFSYLADNLPTWMTKLSDVTAHTAAKHAEFAEAFKKHSVGPMKVRRRRNSSVCSIHTDSVRSGNQRRRRAAEDGDASSSIDSADGPAVISTRHNLIIHYDGYTQKSLEELVRNIGTARNNLRKGKMSQLPLAAGSRSATRNFHARNPAMIDPTAAPEDQLMASVRAARSRGPPPPPPTQRQSPFEMADKHLELAHSFCETAAYHFLRQGGCASELNSVRDRFTVLLKLATDEVQQLQQEKKEDLVEEEAEKVPEVAEPQSQSLKRPASGQGTIEVDDDQASVESIDLSAFRINRLRR
ncbi:hypothetical protein BJY01DRAFT_174740 [Aspergillus pseudoustus]|uniref:Uncharacterized protein n=1 Tax=Aspergillus pseudoustus TaxID=1810923 RepID=A0ABR4K264_9EURO